MTKSDRSASLSLEKFQPSDIPSKQSPGSRYLCRRRFLQATVGLGGVAAVVGDSAPVVAASPSPPSSGYRETEHIRAYYRSLSF